MIAATLFLSLGAVAISEMPEPEADRIVVQAVAATPEMGAREMALARILAEVMPQGTAEYSGAGIRRYSSLAGRKLLVTAMPDHIRIQVVVPRGRLSLAASLLDSAMRRPSLDEQEVSVALKTVPYRAAGYWTEALEPQVPDFSRIRREDVVQFHQAVFAPGRVAVSVGGAFEPGQASKEFAQRFADWTATRQPSLRRGAVPRQISVRAKPVDTLDLAFPTISPKDKDFSAKLLALIALGTGKGSSLFGIWRSEPGGGYVQDAVLWPQFGGFRPRLVLAKSAAGLGEAPPRLIAALMADVEKWSFETLLRAQGMAEAVLSNGSPISPFFLAGPSPLSDSLEDRTFWLAYWRMKTGSELTRQAMNDALRAVGLEELQKAAREMLTGSVSTLIRGTR